MTSRRLAAAHGREESDFIAGTERRAPSREFLVARGDQRRAETRELRLYVDAAGEEVLDARAFADFDNFFGAARDFLEAAEEKDLHANGWRYAAHGGIVTREGARGQSGGVRRDDGRPVQARYRFIRLDPGEIDA